MVFENLEIQRGRPTTIDYAESAERIVKRGRGGYCFHLNGAFGLLLEALGYEVSRRRGTVQPPPETPPGRHAQPPRGARARPADERHPEGTWWAEVGFGDGSTSGRWRCAPAASTTRTPPMSSGPRRSTRAAGAWSQGEGDGVDIIDVDTQPPQAAELAAAHERLSTSPESRFVRTATFQRRDAGGVDVLRARTLSRVERGAARTRLLADEGEWFGALADVFGLELADVDAAERRALWERVCAQHEAWAG